VLRGGRAAPLAWSGSPSRGVNVTGHGPTLAYAGSGSGSKAPRPVIPSGRRRDLQLRIDMQALFTDLGSRIDNKLSIGISGSSK
jgi:hypothetical protein